MTVHIISHYHALLYIDGMYSAYCSSERTITSLRLLPSSIANLLSLSSICSSTVPPPLSLLLHTLSNQTNLKASWSDRILVVGFIDLKSDCHSYYIPCPDICSYWRLEPLPHTCGDDRNPMYVFYKRRWRLFTAQIRDYNITYEMFYTGYHQLLAFAC